MNDVENLVEVGSAADRALSLERSNTLLLGSESSEVSVTSPDLRSGSSDVTSNSSGLSYRSKRCKPLFKSFLSSLVVSYLDVVSVEKDGLLSGGRSKFSEGPNVSLSGASNRLGNLNPVSSEGVNL